MTRSGRVLILSVRAGAGHLRAAEAIEQAFHEAHPELEVAHLEALQFTSKAFRSAFTEGYEKLARDLPAIWGLIYGALEDKPAGSTAKELADFFSSVNSGSLWRRVREFGPDAVVCTHYFPAQMLGRRRVKGRYSGRLYVTLTDFCLHAMWIQEGVDHYFVPSGEAAFALRAKAPAGVEVTVTGIPIAPVFSRPLPPKRELRKRLGLAPGVATVLVAAGGFGLADIHRTVAALAALPERVQLVAVAGKNEELHAELQAVAAERPGKVWAFGFVTNIQELMAASDLMVTKCGGLTSSECLASGLPMAILKPIPGQEERNADFLLEAGAAVRCYSPAHTVFKVQALLRDPARLRRMASAARAASRPAAAFEVAGKVAADVGRGSRHEP